MTSPETENLPAPHYALKRAHLCLRAMKASQSFKELAEHWEQYLIAHQRVWNKCEAKYRTEPFWPQIRSKFGNQRNVDDLLVYLHQARHADEHGIQPITKDAPGSIQIGGNGLIRRLAIDKGQVFLDADPGIIVTFVSSTIVAQPVVNRGATFHPPMLDGQNPDGPSVLALAERGLQFYSAMFAELEVADT